MAFVCNHSLRSLNTFGLEACCVCYCEVCDRAQLFNLCTQSVVKDLPRLVIGEGSNILFTRNFDGLVLKNSLKGIKIIDENADSVCLEAAGGENWHELVLWCVERGYGGIENLSLIPGSVGAAPVQNMGAYGAELKSVLISVRVTELASGKSSFLSAEECELGYRTSIFRGKQRGRFFVESVVLGLSKKPVFNTRYDSLNQRLGNLSPQNLSLKLISDTVAKIRSEKLPDPSQLSNAGSFFKNPVLDLHSFADLRKRYPNMPHYLEPPDKVKIPAAWLIEQCGWRGHRRENAGVYERQPLVLVNYGGATGEQILELANDIQSSVSERFGVSLEPEVLIL